VGGRCSSNLFLISLFFLKIQEIYFFVNTISQDLQMTWISNFLCEEHVVGGQCASNFVLYFLYFEFTCADSLQPGSCTKDPSYKWSPYLLYRYLSSLYWMSSWESYMVGQIKWYHLSFLLVTFECNSEIQWFLAHIHYIKHQVVRCKFYLNKGVSMLL